MMKKVMILLFFLILSSLSVYAAFTPYEGFSWNHDSNSNMKLSLGGSYFGQCSNYPNPQLAPIYQQCDIGSSLYQPIAADFFGNSKIYIAIVPDNTHIHFIDKDCSTQYILTTNKITSAPTVNDMNADTIPDIIVAGNNVTGYQYDPSTETFTTLFTIKNMSAYRTFTCYMPHNLSNYRDYDNNIRICYAHYGQRIYVQVLNDTGSSIVNVTSYSIPVIPGTNGFSTGDYLGLSATTTFSDASSTFWNAYIISASTSTYITTLGILYADLGYNKVYVVNQSLRAVGTGWNGFTNSICFSAKVGIVFKVLCSAYGVIGVGDFPYVHNSMSDSSGSSIAHTAATSSSHNLSSWIAGDVNKDGSNDACYLFTQNNTHKVKCFDNNGKNTFNISVNNITTFPRTITFAQFYRNSTYLDMVTPEGLYVYSGGAYNQDVDTSGSVSGNIIVLPADTGAPVAAYTDTSRGFIIRDVSSLSTCGNGYCDVFENALSCPEDCNSYAFDQTCIADSNCPTAYPKCWAGYCVAGYTGQVCIVDSDCPVTSPICLQNRCILGSNQQAVDPAQTTNTDDMKTNINNAINLILGGNSFLKFILALFLIVFAMISSYAYIASIHPGQPPHMFIPASVGAIMMVALTAFGMIPIYAVILLILVIISVWLLFKYALNPGQGG